MGQDCLELHNYLVSVPVDATVDDMRDRVSAILVAAFYPDYPADSTMHCTPKSALKDLITGKSYQRITTPFPVATNTAPLNEYLVETGERYCYIGHASEGNS
ncbi:hypothetical protein GCM10010873_22480 [Cypionkella aquatica]|uniref:Uncharacterized protein n=1 Tax=Cypionkella aquatica TaxID=1756042 RepID=A0AA37X0T2_9RHOB|nr:hypothetical protein GCM10010873_22480 [Cypionkella aquatica]